MSFPNHVAGGIVFTGVFGSISGVNILTNEWFLVMTVFSSILPDIDHPSSPMGKLFLPISKWINRNYGHRTITHSYIFLGISTLIIGYLESIFLSSSSLTIIFFFGMLSHQIFDMMTVSGVSVFYPFSNAIAVIPGDENLRFTSSNRKVELSIFTFFCLCFALLIPLFETGFWTQYNRTFGTTKHLYSEFTKSSDLLKVNYTYRIGSMPFSGSGFLVESNPTGCTLLDGKNWIQLEKEKMIIEEVIPEHTGRNWEIQQINFVGINTDSLNKLMTGLSAIRCEIHSNNEFSFLFNQKEEQGRVVKATYFHDARAMELQPEIEKDKVTFQASPRIKTLQSQIESLLKNHETEMVAYRIHLTAKEKLQNQITSETDLYQRETYVKKLAQFKDIPKPELDNGKLALLRAQIQEIKLSDTQDYQNRLIEAENAYKSQIPDESHFTGYIKFVTIDPQSLTDL